MRASEAAGAAGVSVKALRYYEDSGLLRPARRSNGYRDYSEDDIRLASEIRVLTSLGLTTQETRPFLDCLRAGHNVGDDCPESLAAYQHKIDGLNDLISQLTSTRDVLVEQLHTAARRGFRCHPNQELPQMLPAADALPDDLPVPQDDGAARHLPGRTLPSLSFQATDGSHLQLDQVSTGRWVLFLYPLTGEPGIDMPRGWDQIPGARGCSQEACSFRDNLATLQEHGAQQVLALSSDDAQYQQDLVRRLHLPYPMLSDPELSLAGALDLPLFEANGWELYKRLTLVVDGATITHVFYPVFPPGSHADEVLDWLRANPVVPG
ncbi:MAG: MerR family transcriptional regulator [Nocardioidaceae bacterium]